MWNQIKSVTSEVNNPPAGGQQHDGAANISINTTETCGTLAVTPVNRRLFYLTDRRITVMVDESSQLGLRTPGAAGVMRWKAAPVCLGTF